MRTDINKQIEQCLTGFESVTLDDINNANLINRHDTKFVFDISNLPELLCHLKENYKILDINDKRAFDYENLYFDTPDLEMYKQHHNGKLNRYKIRFRHYVDAKKYFFEIKHKSNKYKTIKERIPTKDIQTKLSGKEYEFVKEQVPIDPDNLNPQLRINYTRITLLHKNIPEKLTFDTNLFFKNSVRQKNIPNLVIAEIKHDKPTSRNEFADLMKKLKIFSMNLSKYCTGTILTHPDVKYNRFKSKLIFINKLTDKAYV